MVNKFFDHPRTTIRLRVAMRPGVRAGLCLALALLVCVCTSVPTHAQRSIAFTGAQIETVGKEGQIESGTILVKDGKISAVGTDVEIPVTAKIVDLAGKTITPGFVDPYYVVSINRNVQAAATRTVVFNGRTFIIGGGSPAIATTFAKVADGLDLTSVDWDPALRSGITTLHVVTGGFAQSAIAQAANVDEQDDDEQTPVAIETEDGKLLVTVSNDTKSLNVLRSGLKPDSKASTGSGRPSPQQIAAMRARAAGGARPVSTSSSASAKSSSASTPDKLWKAVADGKSPVFVNVNNASTVLHVDKVAKDQSKAKVVLIASGQDAFLTLETLEGGRYSVVLPPRIDVKPNSQYRMNVPKILAEKEIDFALSLSLGQSDFRAQQHTPLFGVAMLVRAGLNRETAMKALTIAPAKMLGLDKEIGTIEVGKKANFVIFDGDPFAATTEIEQVIIEGKPVHEEL